MRKRLITIVLLAVFAAPAAAGPRDKLPQTDGWIACRTANFTLYSNASAGRTKKVAVQLERFRLALGRITRGFELDTEVPTSTFLFKNDTAYTPYKIDRDGKVMNVSGYFLPRPFHNYIALDISAGSRPMRVVYHEFFHAVMDASLGDLPAWLNEGLAEYFSTFEDRGGAVVEVGHPIQGHLQYIGDHGLIPWPEIFATTPDSPTYNEGTRQGSFYAQSWLLVHYLNATDERSKALGRYLSLLRSGEPDETAFGKAFGKSPLEIGADAAAYLETGSNYVRWDFGEEHAEVEAAVEAMRPAEVLYRLGDLLAERGQPEAAGLHLDAAAAEGWPKPEVLAARALGAFYAEQPETAEKLLREAVAAGPPAIEPYVVLSWLLYDRFAATSEAGRHTDQTPAAIAEIRDVLGRGLERAPDDFHALTLLARSYLFDPGDVSPGVAALERARGLRPLDLDLLEIQAALLGRAGRPREAWAVIEWSMLKDDAERAAQTAGYVVNGLVLNALRRAESDDREGAVALLDEAIAAIPDPGPSGELQRMRDVLAEGGRIFVDDEPETSGGPDLVDDYNRAVDLANAGELEQALSILELLVERCGDAPICPMVRDSASKVGGTVRINRLVARINEGVAAANAGDRARAVEILRGVEAEVKEPQLLQRVQELLRSLD